MRMTKSLLGGIEHVSAHVSWPARNLTHLSFRACTCIHDSHPVFRVETIRGSSGIIFFVLFVDRGLGLMATI